VLVGGLENCVRRRSRENDGIAYAAVREKTMELRTQAFARKRWNCVRRRSRENDGIAYAGVREKTMELRTQAFAKKMMELRTPAFAKKICCS